MEQKILRFIFCNLLLYSGCFRLVQSTNTLAPADATVQIGTNAFFECNFDSASSTNPFFWVSYSPKPTTIFINGTTTPDGTQYSVTGNGPYTLTVVNAQPNDALVYCCYTLNESNSPSCANLVVIVSLTPYVNGNNPSTGLTAGPNTIANLTCTLVYSRPVPEGNNPINAYNPNQDPALTMQVGANDVTQSSSGTQTIGNVINALSSKTLTYNASISSPSVGPTLNCTISSADPFMNNVSSISLNIQGLVTNVVIYNNNSNGTITYNISPGDSFYPGSSMNCTAINAYPIPQITWNDLLMSSNTLYGASGPGWSAVTVPATGQSHSWSCSAKNSFNTNPVTSIVSFTVIGGTSNTTTKSAATTNKIALGVGLGVGLGVPILLAIIILIIILKRRRTTKSPAPYAVNEGEKTKKSMDTGTGKLPTNKNGKNPDPVPAAKNNVNTNPNPNYVTPVMPEQTGNGSQRSVRDSPGYGDLGVKHLGGSGSIPHLNESFDSHHDTNAPHTSV